MLRPAALLCVLSLGLASGCAWTGRQADALGSHLPVIGERCEHWQCMTDEGQQISRDNKLQHDILVAMPEQPKDASIDGTVVVVPDAADPAEDAPKPAATKAKKTKKKSK